MGFLKNHRMLTVNEGINKARTEKNAELLDIRTKESFKKGHIAGSISVPMDKLEQVKTKIPSTDTTIYVVGDFDNNPKKAARELRKMGYANVVPSGNMEEHQGFLKKLP